MSHFNRKLSSVCSSSKFSLQEQVGFYFFQNLVTIILEDFSCKFLEVLNQWGLVNLNSVLPGVLFSLKEFIFPLKTHTQPVGRIFQVSLSMTKQRAKVPDCAMFFTVAPSLSVVSCCTMEIDTSSFVSMLHPVLKSHADPGLQFFLSLAFNFSSLLSPDIFSSFI